MSDTTVKKVSSAHSPKGEMGQKYLASGKRIAMRMWQREPAGEATDTSQRDYEIVGYVVEGQAELELEGQTVFLEEGDSWVIPEGARHSYRIVAPFTAIEATSPPGRVHSRDESSAGLTR